MDIDYRCADCQQTFTISVTDHGMDTSLASTHTEKCPSCGQNAGWEQVAFRQCGELTILTYPYFGTNVLGMLWALIGLFPTSIAVATIEMPQMLMAMILLSGVVVSILLDVWWRARSKLVKGWQRFFRPVSGGSYLWMPYWLSWFVLVPAVFVFARR